MDFLEIRLAEGVAFACSENHFVAFAALRSTEMRIAILKCKEASPQRGGCATRFY
jgi:hypothetical protein